MHRAAAEQYKRSSEFNNQTYNYSLIVQKKSPCLLSPNTYACDFQILYHSQSPQCSGLSAEQLIRMVLHTATFKDYHHKSVLPDELGLFLLRPLHFINPERLNTGSK